MLSAAAPGASKATWPFGGGGAGHRRFAQSYGSPVAQRAAPSGGWGRVKPVKPDPGFWKVFKLKICIGIHNASHQNQHDEDVEVDPPWNLFDEITGGLEPTWVHPTGGGVILRWWPVLIHLKLFWEESGNHSPMSGDASGDLHPPAVAGRWKCKDYWPYRMESYMISWRMKQRNQMSQERWLLRQEGMSIHLI